VIPLASSSPDVDYFDVDAASRAELIAHIDALEARLEALLGGGPAHAAARLMLRYRLTAGEAMVLLALADGKARSRARIHAFVYADRADDAPDVNIISVWTNSLRRKLVGTGVLVKTVWGRGLCLAEGVDIVRAVIDGSARGGRP
jgi:Response regulators consisting of a CheY-like receiver domain and a winged-helix DNA-binding domain